MKISWKSSPGWLQLVFHFGNENREEELKKVPCIYMNIVNTRIKIVCVVNKRERLLPPLNPCIIAVSNHQEEEVARTNKVLSKNGKLGFEEICHWMLLVMVVAAVVQPRHFLCNLLQLWRWLIFKDFPSHFPFCKSACVSMFRFVSHLDLLTSIEFPVREKIFGHLRPPEIIWI